MAKSLLKKLQHRLRLLLLPKRLHLLRLKRLLPSRVAGFLRQLMLLRRPRLLMLQRQQHLPKRLPLKQPSNKRKAG